jgi:molybdopterin-guanine dinucleotide biosynthesis protein MobB
VLKHIMHEIDADRAGKDSDRFFQAGVDVLLHGHKEHFFRMHAQEHNNEPVNMLLELALRYDLVLVEGHKTCPVHKVWLPGEGEDSVPAEVENVRAVLPWNTDRLDMLDNILEKFLQEQLQKTPVFGCVNTGDTQLVQPEAVARLEYSAKRLAQYVHTVVITGNSRIAANTIGYPYLENVPGIKGPLAGILAAMRWAPGVSWIIAGCEELLPGSNIIQQLLSARKPGVRHITPEETGIKFPVYLDFRCKTLLEILAEKGCSRFDEFLQHPITRQDASSTVSAQ